MSAILTQHRVGGLPWVVVRGQRAAAFRLLGERFAATIAALVGEMADLELTAHRRNAAPTHFEVIAQRSRLDHPRAWNELEQLAIGAEVPFDALLLLNLRGDTGLDEMGCTDVTWASAENLLFGHNEDGDPALASRCALLTLALDDDPVSTSWWYPGFLPGNTFAVNEHGLTWGLDNVNIPRPAPCGGRAFVARTLQTSCRTLDDAAALLGRMPSAGGFAYTFADTRTRRWLHVETAAGHTQHAGPAQFAWHTNHLLTLAGDVVDRASAESRRRAAALAALTPPAAPSRDWLQALLAGAPVPGGVHRDGSNGDTSTTLCTIVVDAAASEALLIPRGYPAFTIALDDLAHGGAERARPLQPAACTDDIPTNERSTPCTHE